MQATLEGLVERVESKENINFTVGLRFGVRCIKQVDIPIVLNGGLLTYEAVA